MRNNAGNTRWKERLGGFGLYFLERCQVTVHDVDNDDVYTLLSLDYDLPRVPLTYRAAHK